VTFPGTAYLAAVASSFLASAASLPAWRRWCVRTGLVDDPGHRKIHTGTIPLAGGLAVMTGLALPTLLGSTLLWWRHSAFGESAATTNPGTPPDPVYLLSYGLHRRAIELTGILLGAVGMLLLGLLDDKRELKPAQKFIGQLVVALLVAGSGARITLFVPNIVFHYLITALWILTVINAFNFMDNMNGLCAGLGAIGALVFGSIAAAAGQYLVALIAFLTFGALFGFLPYNFPQARAFLGDSGSHLTGYLMAVLAILPHFYTSRRAAPWAVLLPLLVLAVPLLDMAWVVVLRWRKGRPFYVGDTNHLSHRLVRLGLSRTTAVAVIWSMAALTSALAFLL
jgi:UDP-GlcNAc:undecaprenyl-phosphate/decaprenyl-phosphate GlcNAc-1-phosphate transferase